MPIKKAPKVKPLPMIRVNTRIRQNQHRFIKAEAKKTGKTEGEIFREILDKYIPTKK